MLGVASGARHEYLLRVDRTKSERRETAITMPEFMDFVTSRSVITDEDMDGLRDATCHSQLLREEFVDGIDELLRGWLCHSSGGVRAVVVMIILCLLADEVTRDRALSGVTGASGVLCDSMAYDDEICRLASEYVSQVNGEGCEGFVVPVLGILHMSDAVDGQKRARCCAEMLRVLAARVECVPLIVDSGGVEVIACALREMAACWSVMRALVEATAELGAAGVRMPEDALQFLEAVLPICDSTAFPAVAAVLAFGGRRWTLVEDLLSVWSAGERPFACREAALRCLLQLTAGDGDCLCRMVECGAVAQVADAVGGFGQAERLEVSGWVESFRLLDLEPEVAFELEQITL